MGSGFARLGVTRADGKWGTTGGYTTLSGSTATELARKLSAPPEPELEGGCARAVLVTYCGLNALGFMLLGIVGALGENIDFIGLGQLPSIALAFALSLVLVVVTGWILIRHKRFYEAKYAEEKPAWDAAMERYKRLYYCFRDDIVFDPATGQTCQPQSLKEFLYSAS